MSCSKEILSLSDVSVELNEIEMENDKLLFDSPSLFLLEIFVILSSSDVEIDDNHNDTLNILFLPYFLIIYQSLSPFLGQYRYLQHLMPYNGF